MKQHTGPVIISGDRSQNLEMVQLGSMEYSEDWIQNLCFTNQSILPIEEIEPIFAGGVAICRELSVRSGFVDLVYINEQGFITIGECKLWKNPEARRKVIGQIIDYAKDLSQLSYSEFENLCLNARGSGDASLYEIMADQYPDINEQDFVDNVQRNLSRGRFLLAVIGDGIRENMEELTEFINNHARMSFALTLIELPVFRIPYSESLVITPRVIAKTTEIIRHIYSESETPKAHEGTSRVAVSSGSVTESTFFERLASAIGKSDAAATQQFVDDLRTKLELRIKMGRGKKASLNIKSPDDDLNFASIQEDGEVWFYGIVQKTAIIGDKELGISYLKDLAALMNADFDDSMKEWFWCVKRENKYLLVTEYLKNKEEWELLIRRLLSAISEREE
jgi:hypothetical protein